jgi:hypothetical protein
LSETAIRSRWTCSFRRLSSANVAVGAAEIGRDTDARPGDYVMLKVL